LRPSRDLAIEGLILFGAYRRLLTTHDERVIFYIELRYYIV